jgi:hypothetical protein
MSYGWPKVYPTHLQSLGGKSFSHAYKVKISRRKVENHVNHNRQDLFASLYEDD